MRKHPSTSKPAARRKIRPARKLLIFFHVVIFLLLAHHFFFRPMFLDWGAPDSIRGLTFPGDSLTHGSSHTRAILINATPEQLWPWVIQIGQDRGGFYSYEWLENLARAEMKNVSEVRPEFQWPRLRGDTIWLASKDNYDGQGFQILAEISPFKSMVMVGGDDFIRIQNGEKARGSWAFYLHAESPTQTWFIARSSEGDTAFGNKLLRYFTYEVPHFIMERKMLKSVKHLVENSPRREYK